MRKLKMLEEKIVFTIFYFILLKYLPCKRERGEDKLQNICFDDLIRDFMLQFLSIIYFYL